MKKILNVLLISFFSITLVACAHLNTVDSNEKIESKKNNNKVQEKNRIITEEVEEKVQEESILPINSNEEACAYLKHKLSSGLTKHSFGENYTDFNSYKDYDGRYYYISGAAEGIQSWSYQVTKDGVIYNGLECIYAPDGNVNDYQIDNSDEAVELVKTKLRNNVDGVAPIDDDNIKKTINTSDKIEMAGASGFSVYIFYEYGEGQSYHQEFIVTKLGDVYRVDHMFDDPYLLLE